MESESQGWETGSLHLLDLILKKLKSTKHCLHFGVVCLRWHSVFKANQKKKSDMTRRFQVPMLLFPDEDETAIYNVMDNKFLASKLSVPYKEGFSGGSSHGWLVSVSQDLRVTLYKPFSMIKDDNIDSKYTIHLPDLKCLFRYPYEYDSDEEQIYNTNVDQVLITSDPIENPEECTVFLKTTHLGVPVFYRLTKDSSWNLIRVELKGRSISLDNVILHNNQVYVSTYEGALVSIDLKDPSGSTQELTAPKLPKPMSSHNICCKRYLVESNCGNLWHVETLVEISENDTLCKTRGFRIYRLDVKNRAWIRLGGIGNKALFLGGSSLICVNASDFMGIRPNCLYFAPVNHSNYDIGVYDIKTCEIQHGFSIDASILSRTKGRPPIWVVPTFTTY